MNFKTALYRFGFRNLRQVLAHRSAVNLHLLRSKKWVFRRLLEKERDLRQVRISTEFGDMVVELSNQTPQHRDNFLELVENGFYDSLLFHRVINEFMIQGGDPASRTASLSTPLGSGGPGYTVEAEITTDLLHFKGALAAARQGDAVNPERQELGQPVLLGSWPDLFEGEAVLTSKPETLHGILAMDAGETDNSCIRTQLLSVI